MRSLVSGFCLIVCVLAAGCGSIGEPLYPALNIPTRVNDLTAVERGDKIDIDFTIGALTTEGLVLKEIGGVELRLGPNAASAFHMDQWAAAAQRVEIEIPSQPGAIHVEVPVQEFVGRQVLIAARIANAKGRTSEWSNILVVTVEKPLARPSDLRAIAVPGGVRFTWNAEAANSFRVLRKTGQEKDPALLATADKPEFVDTTAEYGKSYDYYVQSFHDKAESEVAGPASIVPKDTFPPATPNGLTVSAGVAAVELAWERNTEADFKEYRVERAEENGPFLKIAEGLEGPSYSDRRIDSGKHYQYRVAAVDQAGNPSAPSQPVEIITP